MSTTDDTSSALTTEEPLVGPLDGPGKRQHAHPRRPAGTESANEDPLGTEPGAMRLEPNQCWSRLQQSRTGRIVVLVDGLIEIRPVNYVANGGTIVFATSSAMLVAVARGEQPVTFEVDEHDGWTVWSVVLRGRASITDDTIPPHGRELQSMLATQKSTRIKITPAEVTGRLFDQEPWQSVGAEPSRDPEQGAADAQNRPHVSARRW